MPSDFDAKTVWRTPHMPICIRLRWLVIGWLESQIQTLITRRIWAYHDRLLKDGFIPDLQPPFPSARHSSAGDGVSQGQ